ncbi:unnamed protein product [Eruca vesicaria subsp. sativa]|uniref:Miro domain-containing protein n=1 Tax=Eruca vesicaria subsp. sativa TaxID=29727 RepID=A0ABC8JEQ5_ERUVS|nr:unnamed protein product [Eruca vesicaria subsp. sativa]
MARCSAGTVDCPGSPKSVRIVVVGDNGTGKSSLKVAAVSDSFPPNVPHVLPDTKLPFEFFPVGVPTAIVDTSSKPEDMDMVAEELRNADAVVLTYDCDRPETLQGLSTYWLPELRRLEVKVPIIVVGCKLDLRDNNNPVSLEQVIDGVLSEAELNDFQVKCFHAPLQPSGTEGVKRVVQEKLPEGVNERGLTVTGFLFLHALFIEKWRLETTWTVLRKFGYNNDIRLADELLPPSLFKRAPDQSIELMDVAIDFLKGMYVLFDDDGDNNLRPQEIEDLFSTAPKSPWTEAPYVDAAEKTSLGGLSFDAFLSLEKMLRSQKATMSYADNTGSTTDEHYAVNMVDESVSAKKTLVMREIPEDGAQGLFSSKESLAPCDIAVFVYDSYDESSWKRATELLVEVATHGEATGYEVPCLMVSAKDDLDSFPISIQESTRVTRDMGIEPPVSISSKLGDFNNLFRKILTVAQHPHLSIPKTKAGKSRKHYNMLINRSLMAVSRIFFHPYS